MSTGTARPATGATTSYRPGRVSRKWRTGSRFRVAAASLWWRLVLVCRPPAWRPGPFPARARRARATPIARLRRPSATWCRRPASVLRSTQAQTEPARTAARSMQATPRPRAMPASMPGPSTRARPGQTSSRAPPTPAMQRSRTRAMQVWNATDAGPADVTTAESGDANDAEPPSTEDASEGEDAEASVSPPPAATGGSIEGGGLSCSMSTSPLPGHGRFLGIVLAACVLGVSRRRRVKP